MTALERLAERKKKLLDTREATQRKLRQTESQERAEARRLHTRHVWALAKVLEDVGLAVYDVETLRPWVKDLAVRMAQGRESFGVPLEDLLTGDTSAEAVR